jgi:Icc protein
MAQRSVNELNKALEERFHNADGIKIIAWMSDIHIHTDAGYENDISFYQHDVDSRRQFALALHEIHSLRPTPELLVLGGDLTDYGRPEELQTVNHILRNRSWSIPTIPLFGNHDNQSPPIHPELMAIWPEIRHADWPEINDPNELYYSVTKSGLKFIILDTQQVNSYKMPQRQKEWLEAELQEMGPNIIILCHRHQLPVGNWVDEESIFRDREVWEMIDRTPNVLGIFSGHVHAARLWQFRRKLYGTFPAVAYGIGDNTGWGGIVLQGDRIAAVFKKDLYGESCDMNSGLHTQAGHFRFMDAEIFQNHVLCNPCYWPWESDPSKRD